MDEWYLLVIRKPLWLWCRLIETVEMGSDSSIVVFVVDGDIFVV